MIESGEAGTAPSLEDIEITLLGPSYGESILIHTGFGAWMIVDSCVDSERNPRALGYLESIGVDPAAVFLIVATHWHDDHMRGLAKLVEVCTNAEFCCASALGEKEFLAAVGGLERHHFSNSRSGVKEIYNVFSVLESRGSVPNYAIANRTIFRAGHREVLSLSPSDEAFQTFLREIGRLFPGLGETKRRIRSTSPNDLSVVLWVRVGDNILLLGADLERRGWREILRGRALPDGRASVFKVPHHGAESAHEADAWGTLVEEAPVAILTPWHRGGGALPTEPDMERILTFTTDAFITAEPRRPGRSPVRRRREVERTLREAGVRLRRSVVQSGAIRLRRPTDAGAAWDVQRFGPARHLNELVRNPRRA